MTRLLNIREQQGPVRGEGRTRHLGVNVATRRALLEHDLITRDCLCAELLRPADQVIRRIAVLGDDQASVRRHMHVVGAVEGEIDTVAQRVFPVRAIGVQQLVVREVRLERQGLVSVVVIPDLAVMLRRICRRSEAANAKPAAKYMPCRVPQAPSSFFDRVTSDPLNCLRTDVDEACRSGTSVQRVRNGLPIWALVTWARSGRMPPSGARTISASSAPWFPARSCGLGHSAAGTAGVVND